nr:DNA polymerase III subunit epsilon [Arenimonas daejeonensis]
MRQIVLDTETTGLSWEKGNRIVEVGCIELMERRPTGRHFQRYFNPGREMEPGAQEVTGLTLDFLQDKPRFETVVDELLEFIAGAELIIHNASFDVGFLNYELSLAGPHYGRLDQHASVLDTLAMARERFPGQRNSLDALCKRLGVDNAHRKLHGALLDAELLAEVYLGLTAGQGDLGLAPAGEPRAAAANQPGRPGDRRAPRIARQRCRTGRARSPSRKDRRQGRQAALARHRAGSLSGLDG